jgi:hypothetical protein
LILLCGVNNLAAILCLILKEKCSQITANKIS